MNFKTLYIEDLEDLNYLAEEVLHDIRFHGYLYNDDGKDISDTCRCKPELLEEHMKLIENSQFPLEFRNNKELMKLSFEDAFELTHKQIIDKYLKPYLSKFRGMMRNGEHLRALMIVDESVSDEYLDNLFALRWKENLKLWCKYYEEDKIMDRNPSFEVEIQLRDDLSQEELSFISSKVSELVDEFEMVISDDGITYTKKPPLGVL